MWKDYSSGYLKNNRASGMSIMVAAFIATLFLSFLCSLFYNFWQDDIAGIILEDGDWQGRIVGSISEEDIAVIIISPMWKRLLSMGTYPTRRK